MKTWIALFRGINVGGKNIVPMKDLKTALEKEGLQAVRTYIQSGNVIFEAGGTQTALAESINKAFVSQFDFSPDVMLLSALQFEKAVKNNPYADPSNDPKSVHLFFMPHLPKNPDIETMNGIKTATEDFQILANVFYMFAPDGIGRSKLAAKAEKLLGVSATARNWRSVTKIMELAQEAET